MYRVNRTHRWRGVAQRNSIPIWLTVLILDLKELNYLKKERKEKRNQKRNKYRTFDDVTISPSKSTSRFVYRRSFVVRPMNCIGITEMECKRRPAVTYRLQLTIGIVSIYLACTIIQALVKIQKPKIKKINKFAKFYVISKRKIVC